MLSQSGTKQIANKQEAWRANYLITLLFLALVGCSGGGGGDDEDEDGAVTAPLTRVPTLGGSAPISESSGFDVQATEFHPTEVSASFGLGGVPAEIVVTIAGCISGFQKTFSLINAEEKVNLVKHDSGCRAELVQFDYESQSYVLEPGETFNTTLGASNTFVGTQGGELYVLVKRQLDDDILPGNDEVEFRIIEVVEGEQLITGPLELTLVQVTADAEHVTEGTDTEATFTFEREGNTFDAMTVFYSVTGTAESGVDYQAPSGIATFGAGAAEVEIDITLIDDGTVEPADVLSVEISPSHEYSPVGEAAHTLIRDDDIAIPTDDLAAYFGPTSILDSSSEVYEWSDISSADNDATQGTSSARPALTANLIKDYSGVTFDGTDDVLIVAADSLIDNGGPYEGKTISVVFKTGTDVSSRQIIWEQGDASRGLNLYIDQGQVYFNGYNTPNDDASTPWGPIAVSQSIQASQAYVATLVYDYSSGDLSGYINGNLMDTASGVGRIFGHADGNGLGGPSGAALFHDSDSTTTGTFFEGAIAEFASYNSALDSSELEELHDYLVPKYGLDTPLVSIAARSSEVREGLGRSNGYIFTRTPAGPDPLTITVTVSGTATEEVDFEEITHTVTIPALRKRAILPLVIIDDNEKEDTETVTLTIDSSASYTISDGAATISILDNDNFEPGDTLAQWLMADTDVHLGKKGGVQEWRDQTSPAVNAIQKSTKRRPIPQAAAIGEMPALAFDGKNDYLLIKKNKLINSGGPYETKTLAMVFRTGQDVKRRQVLYAQGDKKAGFVLYLERGKIAFNVWNRHTEVVKVGKKKKKQKVANYGQHYIYTDVAADQNYYVIVEFDHPANAIRGWLNGNFIGFAEGIDPLKTAPKARMGIGGSAGVTFFHDGKKQSRGNYFKGSIAEVLHFNSIESRQFRFDMEDYFVNKYGF